VSSRVRSIHTEGLDLGDLSAMGQKGLLTDEELKKIRRRFAERQLEETKSKDSGLGARELLMAIEADPTRATSLLPPSSEHAKKALEGLKGRPKSVEDQLRAQLGEAGPSGPPMPPPTPRPESKASRPPEPPRTAAPPQPETAPPAAAPPSPSEGSASSKPASGGAKGGMDLDAMLAQGLISKREYELLMARIKKSGG